MGDGGASFSDVTRGGVASLVARRGVGGAAAAARRGRARAPASAASCWCRAGTCRSAPGKIVTSAERRHRLQRPRDHRRRLGCSWGRCGFRPMLRRAGRPRRGLARGGRRRAQPVRGRRALAERPSGSRPRATWSTEQLHGQRGAGLRRRGRSAGACSSARRAGSRTATARWTPRRCDLASRSATAGGGLPLHARRGADRTIEAARPVRRLRLLRRRDPAACRIRVSPANACRRRGGRCRPPASLLAARRSPPASSISAFSFSASSRSMPSLTGFGASSTSALASLRPRPVAARTTLMTWIFLSPAAGEDDVDGGRLLLGGGVVTAGGTPAAGAAAATAVADTPNSSSSALIRSDSSSTRCPSAPRSTPRCLPSWPF